MALDRSAEGEVAGTYCEEHGPKKYAAPRREWVARVNFDRALCLLWPWSKSPRVDLPSYPGRDAATRDMFAGLAAFETVQSWRKGHRAAPAWAVDLLANELRRTGLERLRAADELQKERGAG